MFSRYVARCVSAEDHPYGSIRPWKPVKSHDRPFDDMGNCQPKMLWGLGNMIVLKRRRGDSSQHRSGVSVSPGTGDA